MSDVTCELCWDLAFIRSRTLGGSQVDHYRKLLIENDANHPLPGVDSSPGSSPVRARW